MKKEDLLKKIKALPDGIDVVLFHAKTNEQGQNADNESSAGIIDDFDIAIMEEDKDLLPEERDPHFKPWAYIEIPETFNQVDQDEETDPKEHVLSFTVDGGATPTIVREKDLVNAIKDYLPQPWPHNHEEELTITVHKKFTNEYIDNLPDSGGQ